MLQKRRNWKETSDIPERTDGFSFQLRCIQFYRQISALHI